MLKAKDLRPGELVTYRHHPNETFIVDKIKGFSVVLRCPDCEHKVTATPFYLKKLGETQS